MSIIGLLVAKYIVAQELEMSIANWRISKYVVSLIDN